MPEENVRSRFRKAMSGQMPGDRLPIIEWAMWWDLTVQRWHGEGLPADLDREGIKRYLGLDVDYQLWFPRGVVEEVVITSESEYEAALPYLYPDPVPYDRDLWQRRADEHAAGEAIVWATVRPK